MKRLADALLGLEPKLRLRASQQLFATLLFLGCILILHYAATLSGAPRGLVWAWTVLSIGAQLLFYGLVRSGWSARTAEPSLTVPQIVVAQAAAAAAYPLSGPLSPLVLPISMLILVFGMFRLSGAAAVRLAWLSLAMLSGAMALAVWVWPRDVALPLVIGHWMMALVTFPGVAILTGRISTMRHRLREQREQLNQALARIEELATRDALTGLYNRRHAQSLLEQAWQRRQRGGSPFCVALIDLDHFKRVNDYHGHAAGDAVLCAFAHCAEQGLRTTDTLARWGGEEFLLLLDHTDTFGALQVLERMQAAVAQLLVPVGEELLRVGFSAGLAASQPDETLPKMLERADQALYRAKAEGRGRVVRV
ncbi:GGDEF domain-containing protein [Inhella proteolytica]|uniref:diguanylate cyclase n=1 Tax=Inhella proteolytica TaxID=2795029 RepID=A0A931JA09_9BURK|nr:GGDEF domain-containing protein [Inhella proteolytica]MBH9579552.1 GGDEF domain-containing protein [Inhella proteolytica]